MKSVQLGKAQKFVGTEKNFGSKKKDQKAVWSKKNLGSEINFWSEKRMCLKKFGSKQNLGPKKFLRHIKIEDQKIFGTKKMLLLKHFWLQKDFVSENIGIPKQFLGANGLQMDYRKYLWSKKNMGPKKDFGQKILLKKNFFLF